MNYIEQVISLVNAGTKVISAIFVSSLVVIILEANFPELFFGLPIWILPTLRMVTIFTLILIFISIAGPVFGSLKQALSAAVAPLTKKQTKYVLLDLDVNELAVLCCALIEGDRIIRLKPDLATTISLKDRGIIFPVRGILTAGDRRISFEVPLSVWRVLLSMKEFEVADAKKLRNAMAQEGNREQIRAALPHRHPAVASR